MSQKRIIRTLLLSVFLLPCVVNLHRNIVVYSCQSGWFSTLPNEYNSATDLYIKKVCLDDAWDVSVASSEVKVGIIDSGINLSLYSQEFSGNVDTSLSRDFYGSRNEPFNPDIAHGTYIASIIGAKGNNGKKSWCFLAFIYCFIKSR